MEEKRYAYRIPPCPAYDVEGLESWLGDLARGGLLLEKGGSFAGVMTFEKGKPVNAVYRLEAVQKQGTIWNDTDSPDEEAMALNQEFGWEFVTRHGDFYIYRSFDPRPREMNTDPQVQALALNAVKKRQRSQLIQAAVYIFIWVILKIWAYPLLVTISIGTPLALFLGGYLVYILVKRGLAIIHLGKLQKQLTRSGTLDHKKDWRAQERRHYGSLTIRFAAGLAVVCSVFYIFVQSVAPDNEIKIQDFRGDPPFVTIEDLFPDGQYEKGSDFYNHVNTIRQWSDVLAPENYAWLEFASVTSADGITYTGTLDISYHETVSPAVARALADNYIAFARTNKYFEFLTPPDGDVEFVTAYQTNHVGCTILLVEGSTVIEANIFLENREHGDLSGLWTELMVERLHTKQGSEGDL